MCFHEPNRFHPLISLDGLNNDGNYNITIYHERAIDLMSRWRYAREIQMRRQIAFFEITSSATAITYNAHNPPLNNDEATYWRTMMRIIEQDPIHQLRFFARR